jgi:hypothetical protein
VNAGKMFPERLFCEGTIERFLIIINDVLVNVVRGDLFSYALIVR